MGRRKHIGTIERLLGIGARTRAHRNFLDTRGTVRTLRCPPISLVRKRIARTDNRTIASVWRASLRCVVYKQDAD